MKTELKLTPLQEQVFHILETNDQITIGEIANQVFKGKRHKPACVNNSITSAIIQINKKCPKIKLIRGTNYGWKGKVVYMLKSDRSKVTLGSTRV